jgi:hypothetical protein
MGLYKNIDIDFASRTLRIIEQYDEYILTSQENYEVTLLVNCLLGLLILPQERRYDLIPNNPVDDLPEWNIQKTFINSWGKAKNGQPAPCTLKELVHRLRNSVAHFHIAAEGTGTDIERLTFSDINGFQAIIPVENLKAFMQKLASTIVDDAGADG